MSRQNDYGALDKFLHHLALGQNLIAEMSYDIEQTLLKTDATDISNNHHVYIAGLARGGTTVLMRRFYASNHFRSLTYRDMPFVLMPGLWKKLTSRSKKHMSKTERAHGDGLLVDYDSPEAFEEVFWRTFMGDDYILKNKLIPAVPDDSILDKYKQYVVSILASGENKSTRYLAKNNNNILRLAAIASVFPSATILVPFRDPLQQAYSLQKQHLRFIKEHKDNHFSRKYMSWLAHHEFGSDHRPFVFSADKNPHAPDTLNYWLYLWTHVYGWLRENHPANTLFCSYENLCHRDNTSWTRIATRTGIDADGPVFEPLVLRESTITEEVDAGLEAQARELYAQLVQLESVALS